MGRKHASHVPRPERVASHVQRVGIDHERRCTSALQPWSRCCLEHLLHESGPHRITSQSRPQHHRIRPLESGSQFRFHVRAEGCLQRHGIGQRFLQCGHGIRLRCHLHETGTGGERSPGGVTDGASHAVLASNDQHPATIAFVHGRSEPWHPGDCPPVVYKCRPCRERLDEPHLHHYDPTTPLPGDDLPAAQSAKRHRELCVHRSVRLSGAEI